MNDKSSHVKRKSSSDFNWVQRCLRLLLCLAHNVASAAFQTRQATPITFHKACSSAIDHRDGIASSKRRISVSYCRHSHFITNSALPYWKSSSQASNDDDDDDDENKLTIEENLTSGESTLMKNAASSHEVLQGSEDHTSRRNEECSIRSILKCKYVSDVNCIVLSYTNITYNSSVNQAYARSSLQGASDDRIEFAPYIAAAGLRRVVELSGKYQISSTHAVSQKIQTQLTLSNTLIVQLIDQIYLNFLHHNLKALHSLGRIGKEASLINDAYFCVNVLYSLARIVRRRESLKYVDAETIITITETILQLFNSDGHLSNFSKLVAPKSQVEFMWSLAILQEFAMHNENISSDTLQNMKNKTIHQIIATIGNRLQSSDALGRLSPREICTALWVYSKMECLPVSCWIAFGRRLRRRKVREATSSKNVVRAVSSASKSLKLLRQQKAEYEWNISYCLSESLVLVKEIESFHNETKLMCYVLVRNLCERHTTFANEAVGPSTHNMSLSSLSSGQVLEVMSSIDFLGIEAETHIYETLLSRVIEDYKTLSFERAGSALAFQAKHGIRSLEWVHKLSERLSLLLSPCSNGQASPSPTVLCDIIRAVAIMFPHQESVASGVFKLAISLLTTDPESLSEYQIATILWSIARCRWQNTELLYVLGNQALRPHVVNKCLPASASKILWSFAVLVPLCSPTSSAFEEKNSSNLSSSAVSVIDIRRLQLEIFDKLGVSLLSAPMSPNDTSRAMWAIAKASYPLDMGVFDHLANHLATDTMLLNSKVRHLSEALWACGKMMQFEDPFRVELEFGKSAVVPPPYLYSARQFIKALSANVGLMSTKDVAQSIWAAGRLSLSDAAVLPIALKAADVASSCNAQELSNILWGFSKLGYKKTEVVKELLNQLKRADILDACSPQEAANIMYALGKLRIREVEVLDSMMAVLKRNLNDVTPQAMSNSLWAYESVGLEPPNGLFDSWAQERLGLPKYLA